MRGNPGRVSYQPVMSDHRNNLSRFNPSNAGCEERSGFTLIPSREGRWCSGYVVAFTELVLNVTLAGSQEVSVAEPSNDRHNTFPPPATKSSSVSFCSRLKRLAAPSPMT